MTRRREVGYCFVSSQYGGGWALARDQYDRVRQAWLKGALFVDAVGLHGDPVTIRLSVVDSVCDMPAPSVMASVEEVRADAADDSLASA